MVNYLKLGREFYKSVPMLEGSPVITYNGRSFKRLLDKNENLKRVLNEVVGKSTNPSLEILSKSGENYGIATFRIKSGNSELLKGAYSKSEEASGIVEKYHVIKDGAIETGYTPKMVPQTAKNEVTQETLGTKILDYFDKELHNIFSSEETEFKNICADIKKESAKAKILKGDLQEKDIQKILAKQEERISKLKGALDDIIEKARKELLEGKGEVIDKWDKLVSVPFFDDVTKLEGNVGFTNGKFNGLNAWRSIKNSVSDSIDVSVNSLGCWNVTLDRRTKNGVLGETLAFLEDGTWSGDLRQLSPDGWGNIICRDSYTKLFSGKSYKKSKDYSLII